MTSTLRFAGAAALCAALLLTACAKKTDQSSTTSTDTTQTATAAPAGEAAAATPAAGASAAPATTVPEVTATPTVASSGTTATTSDTSGTPSGGYIAIPVYPGAIESKDAAGSISVSTNTGSVAMKAYTTKDDAKKVADWYKARLPAAFKSAIMTSDNKTNGTFVDEHSDGDQSVLITSQDDGTTRMLLTTKHGK